MKTSTLFKDAQIETPQGLVKGDVLVVDGKIAAVGAVASEVADQVAPDHKTVHCMGMYLLPGAIDMHVHFREPGATHKEDFDTGSRAAIAGGVTTVVDMPNTNPATTSLEALEAKRKLAHEKSHVSTYFYFGATQDPYNIDEIKEALKAPDVLGVKICMARTTGTLLLTQTEKLEEVMAAATEAGKIAIVHAEDNDEVELMESRFANAIDPRTHSLIRNPMTAYAATKRIIHLAKKVGAYLHVTHLSTALEVDELKKCGSAEGLERDFLHGNTAGKARITADATPHHLFLTDDAYSQWGNMVKVNPPLRFDEDKEALWKALKKGLITCVATDHAPHARAEKSSQAYSQVPAGIPSVEVMLPLLLDAVNHGELTLARVVELVSHNPAKILGLTTKGAIEVGMDADLILVDMNKVQVVGEHKYGEQAGPFNGYFSKAGWSPYEGRSLKGWPVKVWVKGEEK